MIICLFAVCKVSFRTELLNLTQNEATAPDLIQTSPGATKGVSGSAMILAHPGILFVSDVFLSCQMDELRLFCSQ